MTDYLPGRTQQHPGIHIHLSLLALSLVLMLVLAVPTPMQAAEEIPRMREGVVRIHAVAQAPDYHTPWNPGRIVQGTGSGFLIGGQMILTNAHVASNARLLTVEKEGDSRRYEARVKHIAHDCDLALLSVSDASFFNGMRPLALGQVPALDSSVRVLGYPIGGNRLSITRGVVSRIDYQTYSHSAVDSHLAIQIDAAINPGNSGGPVVQNGAVVGVAFQGYGGHVAQNVGYMIPTPVIRRFISDVKDGRYDHYVDLGLFHFPLINATHRRALGLTGEDLGVVVSDLMAAGAAGSVIEIGDILLAIDGLPIYSDGRVRMDGERVLLNEVVERKFAGDSVDLKIRRDGEIQHVTVRLNRPWPYLMHARRHDSLPQYVIFAGLVFQPLSSDFIKAAKTKNPELWYHYYHFLDEGIYLKHPEVVVLSRILQDPINTDLQDFQFSIVSSINGTRIRTLKDLYQALTRPDPSWKIAFINTARTIILESEAVQTAQPKILELYNIPRAANLEGSIVPDQWLRNQQQHSAPNPSQS